MEETEILKIIKPDGTEITLCPNYEEYGVLKIEGLEPPETSINISEISYYDGGTYNSSRINVRNIVIFLVLFGDNEETRKKLYGIFQQKNPIGIYYKNSEYEVKTEGYVKHFDPVHFKGKERVRIELVCPGPYLHDVNKITGEFRRTDFVVTANNTGDFQTGFEMTLNFGTDDPPGITLGEATTTLNAVFPYQKNLMLNPMQSGVPVADNFDPETQKIMELMIGGVDYTNSIGSVEKIIHQYDSSGSGAATLIHVEMAQNVFGAGTYSVSYVVASVDGGSMETVEYSYYVSASMSASVTMANCNINFRNVIYNENFFKDKDFYKVLLKNAAGTWVEVTEQCTLLGEASIPPFVYAHFDYDLYSAGFREGKLVIYHDTNGADLRSTLVLHQYSGTRTPSTDWYANMYSTIPAGFNAAKDIPYINGIRIPASDISYQYIVSGGTTTEYPVIYGDTSAILEFRYVYSLGGNDIRIYNQDQVDSGLTGVAFTRGVCIWNESTDEWLYFKDARFQTGDTAKISTIPGNIYAKITERNGSSTDISLLWDAYKNGTFFKLKPGNNDIKITAVSGGEYVTGYLEAEALYGGV